jgi:hypothetical protein
MTLEEVGKMPDEVTQEEIALMASSASEDEWNKNCDKIKRARGGKYPEGWFRQIILSGLASLTETKWRGR